MMSLLKIKGFLSYLLVVFLNAFVDLGHKIIIQNTVFKAYDGTTQIILTALVNAMILLPFVLLLTPAGFLSDRFAKPKIMRISAIIAVFITLAITIFYYLGLYVPAFIMTLLLAAQSAIYSPAKYGYIREIGGDEVIAEANAAVQGVTVIAILSGIFIFSFLFEMLLTGTDYRDESMILSTVAPLGWLLVAASLIELILAWHLPIITQGDSTRKFVLPEYIKGKYLQDNLLAITNNRIILFAIIALSGFWSISQVALAAFPAYAKETLAINNTVIIQGILASSGIGIALGSALVGRISRHKIEEGLIPLGAIGLFIAVTLITYIQSLYMLAVLFVLIGLFGAMMIVPLNSLIQYHADNNKLGTIIAGNNWVQNISMLLFLVLTMGFAYAGLQSIGLFYIISLISLLLLLFTLKYQLKNMLYFMMGGLFKLRYQVNVSGAVPMQGGALILSNHISYIDWAIIQLATERKIHFVIEKEIHNHPLFYWFLRHFNAIPISQKSSKESLSKINQLLKQGKVVCLFPEGGISYNGHFSRFRRGFEKAAFGTGAKIIPCYIHGLWGSLFSRANSFFKKTTHDGWRRKIYIGFGQPLEDDADAVRVKQNIFDASVIAWRQMVQKHQDIATSFLAQVKKGPSKFALADSIGAKMSRARVFTASALLARQIKQAVTTQNVGIILPSSSAALITNMACFLSGKTAVNLNFTAPDQALLSAIEQANVAQIYTSRKFVDRLAKKGFELKALSATKIYYLEDITILKNRIAGLLTLSAVYLLPKFLLAKIFLTPTNIKQPAAIMFSSGSEGKPKGIVLSHLNIQANAHQVYHVLHRQKEDVIMASLPFFHAMGFTITGIMPLVSSVPVVYHPDPTDVFNIARIIDQYKASFYCGTATFLRMFTRNQKVKPQMLVSLRHVVVGAEKLDEAVRDEFYQKFSKNILEGYGTTETSPVASVNVNDISDHKAKVIQQGGKLGTTGMPLPGTSFRVVDPLTFDELPTGEAGLLVISGPQVMVGYLNDDEKTRQALLKTDNNTWYKTGDKGTIDKDGFISIVDRYSRFAKIGGEMISLGAVEKAMREIFNNMELVAVNIKHHKKGEAIVMFFSDDLSVDEVMGRIRESTAAPLMRPFKAVFLPQIPKLGSGKTDYTALKILAENAYLSRSNY